MKDCRICKINKGSDDFYKRSSSEDGLRSECIACHNQHSKTYYDSTQTQRVLFAKTRRLNHGTDINTKARQDYKNRPEYYSAKNHLYVVRHPEAGKLRTLRRRAKQKNGGKIPTKREILDLWGSYLGLCVYCTDKAEHLDHVVPIALGGTNDLDNLVPACAHCNHSKKDKQLLVWMAT